MAVVLLIVTLLVSGLVPGITSQLEQQRNQETKKTILEIKDALIGFAIVNGRLPCPASATSKGMENFASGENAATGGCSNFFDGFVPAATLGLSSANKDGITVDAWGNPIHYGVSSANSNAYTKTGGMSAAGIAALQLATKTPSDIAVCSSSTNITSSACGAGLFLTSAPGVPAIVYSIGKNGAYGGTSADEAANPNPNSSNNDPVYVSGTPSPDFDDIVDWISPNILISRMLEAGVLP
jgi:type II secretory pathway pseudopilin PulG